MATTCRTKLRLLLSSPSPPSFAWRASAFHKQGEGRKKQVFVPFSTQTTSDNVHPCPDPSLVDITHAPLEYENGSAVVYPTVVSPTEANALMADLDPKFKRRRYERGHWDAVIVKYKEIELEEKSMSETSQRALHRIRELLGASHMCSTSSRENSQPLPESVWLPCHAIDLHADGELNAHVDSVRYSGDIVSGLSLLSPAIMRLCPDDTGNNDPTESEPIETRKRSSRMQKSQSTRSSSGHVDLYLPPCSLYVLSGTSRYDYSHQLLPTGSIFTSAGNESIVVHRGRRLSVIFRDAKDGNSK